MFSTLRTAFVAAALSVWAAGTLTQAAPPVPVSRINISIDDKGYYYTTKKFAAKAGSDVKVVLAVPPNSRLPGANLIILKPRSEARFLRILRAMPHPRTNQNKYVPASNDILCKTGWVVRGARTSLSLKVPTAPGTYTYLCTWPRGIGSSMRGTMIVVK